MKRMNPAHKGSLLRETNGKDKEQYIHTWRNNKGLQRCLEVEFLWYSLSSSYKKEPQNHIIEIRKGISIYSIKGNLENQRNEKA